MRSTTIQKVYDKYKDYDVKLRADDPRFNQYVYVELDDGCSFFFRDAFYMEDVVDDEKWLIIFPEHHDYMVVGKEDVKKIESGHQGDVFLRGKFKKYMDRLKGRFSCGL